MAGVDQPSDDMSHRVADPVDLWEEGLGHDRDAHETTVGCACERPVTPGWVAHKGLLTIRRGLDYVLPVATVLVLLRKEGKLR